jgi:tetratricopeptide (TPR) repeat protein
MRPLASGTSRRAPRARRALLAPLALAAGLALAVPALGAQPQPVLIRPSLPAGADTNDVTMYLLVGGQMLERQPQKAVQYFRWAAALDPRVPDAPYGERIALLLSDRNRLMYYWRGDRKTHDSPDIKRADSLQSLALTRAPLFFRRYDGMLLRAYFDAAMKRTIQNAGLTGEDEAEMRYEMNKWLNSSDAPPYLRAWFAYSDGDFPKAARLYAEAIGRARKGERGDLLAERARVLAHLGANDSAVATFRASMAADSARDEDRLVFALRSKAQMEHVLGALFEAEGDTAGARQAYERALTEDLGYFPAHVALGTLAYERGDTAVATHELREAVQIAGDDANLHYVYGLVLSTTGNVAQGVTELLKAAQLAPQWAEPHFLLARLHDAADMREEAIPHWQNFLARASLRHPGRQLAEQRVAAKGAR